MIIWKKLENIDVIPKDGTRILVCYYGPYTIKDLSLKCIIDKDFVYFDTESNEWYKLESCDKDVQVNYADNILNRFTHYSEINNPED
jgi:hypothetical protein